MENGTVTYFKLGFKSLDYSDDAVQQFQQDGHSSLMMGLCGQNL
jgi:hypothetical protein